MPDLDVLSKSLTVLFAEKLNVEVPSVDSDLLQTGILDSMSLVELFLILEREYGVKISMEDLEIENFKTISKIARFVAGHER
jgi:acyl carrier protein